MPVFRSSQLYFENVNNIMIYKGKYTFVKNNIRISSKPLKLESFLEYYSIRSWFIKKKLIKSKHFTKRIKYPKKNLQACFMFYNKDAFIKSAYLLAKFYKIAGESCPKVVLINLSLLNKEVPDDVKEPLNKFLKAIITIYYNQSKLYSNPPVNINMTSVPTFKFNMLGNHYCSNISHHLSYKFESNLSILYQKKVLTKVELTKLQHFLETDYDGISQQKESFLPYIVDTTDTIERLEQLKKKKEEDANLEKRMKHNLYKRKHLYPNEKD
jgi:hypothetical protein